MKEIEIQVSGMMCHGCENRIKNVLESIEKINQVEADYTTGIVKVIGNEELNEEVIKDKIKDIGFEII